MPIPPKHAKRFIYHFTHIDNLPDILQSGFLCNTHPDFPNTGCRSIAEEGIQERRAAMEVPCGPGGVVHDYVPLYFGSLSPMLLAVINKKNVDQMDILYFEFPIFLLDRDDVVFTDASANALVPPNFYEDPSELENLNWGAIDSLKWSSPDDQAKHQRMAEALVFSSLPLLEAARVVVWNESIRDRVQAIVKEAGVPFPPLGFQSEPRWHYFTKFWDKAEKGHSPAKGPREIAMNYEDACKAIAAHKGQKRASAFGTPKDLLLALRQDFSCLPHTAELVGLQSENGVHHSTVDVHTLEVVENLRGLPEFTRLPPEYQDRVELAAYLHDIGKGPKSRWEDNGGLQKVDPDHPARAMPMMVEILTERVTKVKQRNADLIVKLVCYHDLVGEVLGKGRDERQIVDVAADELELDMLFELGKADATSLVEWWWNEGAAAALRARCVAAIKSRNAV
jgi:ssDNA thymidine ADP-ribosyltransferase, DarT/HD domain